MQTEFEKIVSYTNESIKIQENDTTQNVDSSDTSLNQESNQVGHSYVIREQLS